MFRLKPLISSASDLNMDEITSVCSLIKATDEWYLKPISSIYYKYLLLLFIQFIDLFLFYFYF